MSVTGPAEAGPADWSRADWQVLRRELAAIARLASELRLWTVLGSVHPLTPPHRPHNSMYVISDRGELITRYDERLLSTTKLSFMYTPGSGPVTFEVDGLRFGCAMGIEVHFPEVWAEYERLDVDGVVFSTGPGQTPDGTAAFATEAQAHAATNGLCVSFAMSAQHSAAAPAGIIAPDGRWAARCPADGHPARLLAEPAGCYRGRVSRVHDMGGQTGFGPVPVADDGTMAFHADWEARVYALAAVLRQRGLFNSDELRDAIERLPPAEYLGASYYERWLGAIETLVAEKASHEKGLA